MDYGFHPRDRNWETHHLNAQSLLLSSQTHHFQGMNWGVLYINSPHTKTGWAQIAKKKNAAAAELGLRELLYVHKPPHPPAVPDDPLESSRRKIQVESGNENKYSKKRDPKRKDKEKSESSFVTPEFPVPSRDSDIDAAKSHMALYDSQVRQRLSFIRAVDKDETDIYLGYSTSIEISDDLDNISSVAQKGVKIYADDRKLGVDENSPKDLKGQSRHQKSKEGAH